MEWVRPQSLYLILPLALGWLAVSLRARRLRFLAAEAFAARPLWPRIFPKDSPARFWGKLVMQETALILGLIALAGPRFGIQEERVIPRGSDLYVLIDVSRSMLAEDVFPSRLGRAKADVSSLLNRLEGERIGLIAFAGQAVVKCPLTVDYDSFRRSLSELDPGSAPRGGTAIGDAIRKALEVFDARSGRDQAILLITDGDDQQSYPLEAADVASERQVAIFTVGLGDSEQGARIPRSGDARSFVEYQGQQVWSKLDGSLLEQIALKTSGVYVPAGTRTYDLGDLYVNYLRGRRGEAEESRTRSRRAERFQIPLALALLALLLDLLIRRHPATAVESTALPPGASLSRSPGNRTKPGVAAATSLLLLACVGRLSGASEPADVIRQGLQHYRQGEFEQAGSRFKAAREDLQTTNPSQGEIAAFDEACAAHRRGEVSQARELYLQAGLSRDRRLAGAAHFNLGTLSAEEARRLAGPSPEEAPPEKRQEILDLLRNAVASFRHSLEVQPENRAARRDIELVRQWMKYYGDRWRERDRRQRRKETNLLKFLEFLIQSQRELRQAVGGLGSTAPADAFAELKRQQDELAEEIGPLKEKIQADLQPQASPGGSSSSPTSDELEQGLKLLQEWADAAGTRMAAAARQLGERRVESALNDQRAALDELEKIWEAVIPFQALLAHDLAEQTVIAAELEPASADQTPAPETATEPGESESADEDQTASANSSLDPSQREPAGSAPNEAITPVTERQERTRRRTQLLLLKAQAEMERLEQAAESDSAQPKTEQSAQVDEDETRAESAEKADDSEQVRQWYQQAIDLAPRAIEQMETALQSLKGGDRDAAYPSAEEARRILEEIQKSQPPDQQQQDQNEQQQRQEQDQQQQNQPDQNQQDSSKEQNQNDDQNSERQPEQSQSQPKNQPTGDPEQPAPQDPQKRESRQSQSTRDKVEETLRKVRERQDAKRERDRRVKTRISGGVPVEKDW